MTSLAICKPIDKEVTPNNSKSCTCEDPSSVRPRHTDALIVQQSASPKVQRVEHNPVGDQIEPGSLLHVRVLRFAAAAAAAAARGLLLLLHLRFAAGAAPGATCFQCTVCLSVFSPISPISLLRPDIGSLQPCHHREPVRPLFWLLARLGAVLWRYACWIRRQSGSTMPFSTTSCVYSTHHCFRTNDFCSPLLSSPQRILLAFYFLPLHFLVLAPPGPQLHSLALFAPPEHSLLSHSS